MQAALEFLLQTGRQPDILHCHDWSTAILAETYWCVTIHSLSQGRFYMRAAVYPSSGNVKPASLWKPRLLSNLGPPSVLGGGLGRSRSILIDGRARRSHSCSCYS